MQVKKTTRMQEMCLSFVPSIGNQLHQWVIDVINE